jgi:hypothetical protein
MMMEANRKHLENTLEGLQLAETNADIVRTVANFFPDTFKRIAKERQGDKSGIS